MLAKDGPQVLGGSVAVIGQRVAEHRDPAGPVALVENPLPVFPREVARRALDGPVDVVLRHRRVLRALDRICERRIVLGVRIPLPCGHLDRAQQLREELSALGVCRALLFFDALPVTVAAHRAQG